MNKITKFTVSIVMAIFIALFLYQNDIFGEEDVSVIDIGKYRRSSGHANKYKKNRSVEYGTKKDRRNKRPTENKKTSFRSMSSHYSKAKTKRVNPKIDTLFKNYRQEE
jgi:hypothetical protein